VDAVLHATALAAQAAVVGRFPVVMQAQQAEQIAHVIPPGSSPGKTQKVVRRFGADGEGTGTQAARLPTCPRAVTSLHFPGTQHSVKLAFVKAVTLCRMQARPDPRRRRADPL